GAVTALGTIGVDVGALIAALGLTGFAIGLAFKDIVSNALSGILIIIYKPFEQGDQIKVSSFAGNVRSIDLRYTILSSDGDRVFVPNSLLFSNAITVESQQTAQTT
ncbi:MAG: mechanosensitive ion channel domain-containing protein, partial [Planctomycetaceae bacterium]